MISLPGGTGTCAIVDLFHTTHYSFLTARFFRIICQVDVPFAKTLLWQGLGRSGWNKGPLLMVLFPSWGAMILIWNDS
jgi:hypothetical protein